MKPPPTPLTPSGLAGECRRFLGKPLLLRCVFGWGWTHYVGGEPIHFDDQTLYSSSLWIVPEGFVEFTTRRSGIYGAVLSSPEPYFLKRFVAFTMSDGCDYDFTENIAPCWRVMLGDGALDYDSGWFPLLRGADVYFGYGSIGADEHAFALAQELGQSSE